MTTRHAQTRETSEGHGRGLITIQHQLQRRSSQLSDYFAARVTATKDFSFSTVKSHHRILPVESVHLLLKVFIFPRFRTRMVEPCFRAVTMHIFQGKLLLLGRDKLNKKTKQKKGVFFTSQPRLLLRKLVISNNENKSEESTLITYVLIRLANFTTKPRLEKENCKIYHKLIPKPAKVKSVPLLKRTGRCQNFKKFGKTMLVGEF